VPHVGGSQWPPQEWITVLVCVRKGPTPKDGSKGGWTNVSPSAHSLHHHAPLVWRESPGLSPTPSPSLALTLARTSAVQVSAFDMLPFIRGLSDVLSQNFPERSRHSSFPPFPQS
jgi:hypothetical protein